MPLKLFGDLGGEFPAGIVRCPFDSCNTRIIGLSPKLTSTMIRLANAPAMAGDGKSFLEINDVWDFDNVGVSRVAPELKESEAVGQLSKVERLLVCGECDKGPIGFAGYVNAEDSDVKNLRYYLSCESVKYDVN